MLIAAFDAARIATRIADLVPPGADVVTLDEAKLPADLVTSRARYLDKQNFATNFVFFRDADGLSTRLVSANYWAGYGGGAILLWLRLFDAAGQVLTAHLAAGRARRTLRLFHRQPRGARALRTASLHRAAFHPCGRCGGP